MTYQQKTLPGCDIEPVAVCASCGRTFPLDDVIAHDEDPWHDEHCRQVNCSPARSGNVIRGCFTIHGRS